MATVTGRIGDPYATQSTIYPCSAPVSLNVTMPTGKCPSGAVAFSDVAYKGGNIWGNYWAQTNHAYPNNTYTWPVYLCDSAGNNAYKIMDVVFTGNNAQLYAANYTQKSGSSALATGLAGKALYIKVGLPSGSYSDPPIATDFSFRGVTEVVITYADAAYGITVASGGNGTLTANKSSAAPGDTVTLTPTANTGYYLSGYTTNPSLTISNNQFTMPGQAVSITANFSKISYSISKAASPGGGGTVSTKVSGTEVTSAVMGATVTVTQTANTSNGYYFNGWTTSPANLISGGSFTMPAGNVSITANYLRRSTASVNKTTIEGGGTLTLTVSTESASYTHAYTLSFPAGMSTSGTISAGSTTKTINIPENWSTYVTTATSTGSGTLVVTTYSGNTAIGTYTITGFTYNVPASVKPIMGTVTTSIVRTINGTTYANVGAYYVQNKCGVRTQASASGNQNATISSISMTISGYSGSSYSKTSSGGSLDFTSGLLTKSGTATITVTATDSRGRTNSVTTSISVKGYTRPSGSLKVWRVNNAGTKDDMGTYGKYELTKNYTTIGSNSLTSTLNITGISGSASNPATSGDLLPRSRKTFAETNEYTVNLTLTDSFETVTITATLPSARFIIYVDSTGNKLGFMKVTNKSIPSGKSRTVEFSADTQIYIGDVTLEDYIRSIT